MDALGECMKRSQAMSADPGAAAKIRNAALEGLDDADPRTRELATRVLSHFRSDPEVRSRLTGVATADPYQEGHEAFRARPGSFTVREAARSVLDSPQDDESYFFVMRAADSRECRVQKGSERPKGDRYIGPEAAAGQANFMLCTHVDTTRTSPDLCWSVSATDACK